MENRDRINELYSGNRLACPELIQLCNDVVMQIFVSLPVPDGIKISNIEREKISGKGNVTFVLERFGLTWDCEINVNVELKTPGLFFTCISRSNNDLSVMWEHKHRGVTTTDIIINSCKHIMLYLEDSIRTRKITYRMGCEN